LQTLRIATLPWGEFALKVYECLEDNMTGIDKILVIIVLIFSVVFVIAAIGGFSKNQAALDKKDRDIENYKALADQSGAKLGVRDAELRKSNEDKEKLREQGDETGRSLQSRDEKIERLETEIREKDDRISSQEKMIDDFKGRLDGQQKDIQDLTEKFDKMTEDNRKLGEEKRGLQSDVDNYKNVIVPNKDKEIEDLKERIRILERPEDGKENGLPPQKKIDCTVLEVKRDEGLAIVGLDKGTEDGLEMRTKLYVWSSTGGLKGRITIIEISEKTSIARIDWEEDGKEITKGDTATVQDF